MSENNKMSIENGKHTIEKDGRKITFKVHDLDTKSPSFRRDIEFMEGNSPSVGVGIFTDTDTVVWSIDCSTHRTLREIANIQQNNIAGRFQISNDDSESLTLFILMSEHADIKTVINFLKKSQIYSDIELDIKRLHIPYLSDDIYNQTMDTITEPVFEGKLANFKLDA